MASLQLQRSVNAETITKTAIDQKQSQEVVQTMLHGALSSLSYLRNFFREEAFDLQIYEMSEKIHSYEDYAAGRLTKTNRVASTPKTVMQVLRRNRSKRADVFLDWLENGAFAALQDGTLHALQVYVHADPEDRNKVIETYTFTVKYLPGTQDQEKLAGLEMDSPGSSLVTVAATSWSLQDLLKQIINICRDLPDLPDKKFVSMELFYKDKVTKPAKLKGWVTSASDNLLFAGSEGWEKRVKWLEELESGFHSTSFKVSHLQPTSEAGPRGRNCFSPPKIPMLLQYNQASSKREELCTPEQDTRITVVDEASEARENVTCTGSPKAAEETEKMKAMERMPPSTVSTSKRRNPPVRKQTVEANRSEQGFRPHSQATALGASHLDNSIDTQSSNVLEMKTALKEMMLPESLTQGDTQIEGSVDLSITPTDHSNIKHTAWPHPKSTKLDNSTESIIPDLLEGVAAHLDNHKQGLRSAARQFAKAERKVNDGGELIACQCCCDKDDGDMVCCVYCETWQHLPCYGYTGDKDPRLPSNHVCYQCLLGENEEDTLRKLCDLAQKRRGVRFALENGLKTQRDFAVDTGLPMRIFVPLVQHLRSEGYIAAAKGARKAGYAASGKPQFVMIKNGPNYENLLRNLYDPMMHIGHHYKLPSKLTTPTAVLAQQLLAYQEDNMPPPVTPASQLRKKKIAQTPPTGLDLRASMTPFETPSRSRSRKANKSKRSRDDSEDAELSPKRRATAMSSTKRWRSVQTKYMLDANSLAPSPSVIAPSSEAH